MPPRRRSSEGQEDTPPTLYVVVPGYPLTDFLFEHMHELEGVRIMAHPTPRRRWFSSLLRSVDVYLLPWAKRSFFFDKAYTGQLERIRPEDSVLFFAIENRKDLQIIRKFIGTQNQKVWLWNPVGNYRGNRLSRWWYFRWLGHSGMRVYTFNRPDARSHGIRLLNQVYRHPPVEGLSARAAEPPLFDVYFLGIDKGRLPALQRLRADFERAGLSTHFHVVADKRKRYSQEDLAWVTRQWLPYSENLRKVSQSRALLELLQSGQGGATMRSMEAAFLDKKLITDNSELRHTGLYHPSRIFILGQDDPATLRQFIHSPIEPLASGVLDAYDIEHRLQQFAKELV
jgi:hypothetical protein